MSDLKRKTDFQFGNRGKSGPSTPGIEDSQPRQTLEVKRATEFLDAAHDTGCDPYNTIGTRPIRVAAR
jgi:hypothetical protein